MSVVHCPHCGTRIAVDNPLTEEEKGIVARTARKSGAVGAKALVPRAVVDLVNRGIIPKNAMILDFGAGPGEHTKRLREMGLTDVTAYELPESRYWDPELHDPHALEQQYDVIYASNVLNVQPSEEALRSTAQELLAALAPNGIIVANYPGAPRKLPPSIRSADAVKEILSEYFYYQDRIKGFGSKSEPVWILRR